MHYYSYIERPDLDAFSVGYSPRDGLASTIITFWFQATGRSGTAYNLIRAIGMPTKDHVLNFGFYRGSGDVDVSADLFVGHDELSVVEPISMSRTGDAIVYSATTFEIAMRPDGYTWQDANGRVQLHAERVGDACTVWVPPQHRVENGFLDRSHMCKVTGTIDGDPVEGMFMDDHLYSRAGINLHEAKLTSAVENYWQQWLVEYEDGSLEGGSAWRGQPGTGFNHSHHYVNGRSHARRDSRFEVIRNSNGSMQTVRLTFPGEVWFEFEQLGSYDWPFHTYGRVASTSRRKKIAKSWHYVENWPTNMAAVEEFQAAYQRLYGQSCSLRRLLEGARLDNEALVLVPADRSADMVGVSR